MADVKKIATRESYGNTLKELAAEGHEDLVVLDADLAAATKTGMFRKAYPDRHFDCGIAEENMMGVAAGLSTMGYVPFVSSFAMFAAGRAFEQVRNSIGYPHLNVKIGATHGGISVGEDGASHQCCEDFALMRSIPGMTVICPADDVEARAAVRAAYAMEGPVYLRFGRLAVPVFHDAENYHFEIGKGEQIRLVLTSLFAGGHVLIDDIPGVGKTTMALAFSKALSLRYNRVQFTPDVMPSDITGFTLYNKEAGRMEYQPGAVLCNLFLADELNRATSRTQSALLEAMEEGQVTVDGVSHPVPQPFLVIATQNPAGASGTQLLPDSQLDRFMVKLSLGYPEPQDELRMLRRKQKGNPLDGVQQALDKAGLAALRAQTDQVYVSDDVLDYIVRLVAGTRTLPELVQGASPRATLAVAAMAKAAALARGADYVTPADVRRIFHCTVAHRLIPAPQTRDVDALLDDLMRSISAPQLK